ncbi:FadR/GntR family transcriptional regulator [Mesorhizobium australicum]|uniref:Transcriptional regulator, GntR family n=1 Tax=Mesorhizobium australicum TaxID=536018 RepID=A0A1X7N206_9HYPH|nr:FCD domain-containing protein [Mesorhizobium australicum]SMH30784.1 transcriptional regulator, GntR family [Mesorhizobium australicum]
MNNRNVPTITPVQVPKAADILAAQLREMIVSGKLLQGSFLPTERQLVADSGLSRTSVRDALRILESEGLITTKVGRSGGSMVTLPGREAAAKSFELFVRTHGIRLDSLLKCRVAVEPTLAELAAENRTEAQLAEMEALHEQFVAVVDDVPRYKSVNLQWHLAIARASGNEPLVALMEAIAMPIKDAQDYQHVTTPELRRTAVAAHTKILDAIRRRDAKSAFRRMHRHVAAYHEIAVGGAEGMLDEKTA